MKCNYEKPIHELFLKTKYTTAGAYAVLDVIRDHYQAELDKLPKEEQDDAVMNVKDFLIYLDKTGETLEFETGVEKEKP